MTSTTSGAWLETKVKQRFAKVSIVSKSKATRMNLGTFYDTELNSDKEKALVGAFSLITNLRIDLRLKL